MRSIGIFALALAAVGCMGDGSLGVRDEDVGNVRRVAIGEEFTMTVHEVVVVDDTHLLISFDGVTEDSRCPTDVQCPWEGNAAVRLELSSEIAEFAPQPRVLNTSLEPRSTDFMGLTIRLVDVAPYPSTAGQPIDPESYVVKLVVTRS
jgi:hypothetical protein